MTDPDLPASQRGAERRGRHAARTPDEPVEPVPEPGFLTHDDPHADGPGDEHPDEHHDEDGVVGLFAAAETPVKPRRGDRHRRRRRKTRGRALAALAFVLVLVLAVAAFVAVRNGLNHFKTKDYAGAGTGTVLVQIKEGDTSDDIAATLVGKKVVASSRAFVNAAKDSGKSSDFQPGYFKMREHMAAKSAVTMLLDPANRVFSKLTIPEGWTTFKLFPALSKATGVSEADLKDAAKQLDQLGIPEGYDAKSLEGFLFPQTYEFDPQMSALEVLQQLVAQYSSVDKQINFDQTAEKNHLKPYEALIVASMVESEAKYDGDRAKVARVIYNRLAKGTALGIDATSLYGAALEGKSPSDVTYNENSPYNTRHKPGLPPTAISNPGQGSMVAAANPAAGNWLWYVNGDAQGHLYFASTEAQFEAARLRCKANHWGCD